MTLFCPAGAFFYYRSPARFLIRVNWAFEIGGRDLWRMSERILFEVVAAYCGDLISNRELIVLNVPAG